MADFTPQDFADELKKVLNYADRFGFNSQTAKDLAKDLKRLDEQVKKGVKSTKEQTDQFIELTQKIKDFKAVTDEEKKERRALMRQRTKLAKDLEENTNKEVKDAIKRSLGKGLTDFTTESVGKLTTGLQNGASATQMATDVASAAIDATGSALKSIGGTAMSAGSALAMIPGPAMAWGRALMVTGGALSLFGESASKVAKFAISVLAKEVERTVTAFQDTSSAGALFANGMTGMRDAAMDAGLTTEQFAGVMKNQAGNLAAVGIGVTEAAKMMGQVKKGLAESGVERQLQKLGFGFQEQAELVAETMGRMRVGGGPMNATTQQIQDATARYAENLRILGSITGEDAKKRMAQAQEEAKQLAFQQKLAGMDATQREAVIQSMAFMSDTQKKAFMDRVAFDGNVINAQAAASESLNDGLRSTGEGFYSLLQQGLLTPETVRDLQGRYSKQITQNLQGQIEIGRAQAAGVQGIANDLGVGFGRELSFFTKMTGESISASEANTEAQKNASDVLTEGVVNAGRAAQQLAIDLQEALMPAIGRYAEYTKEVLSFIQKMISEGDSNKPDLFQQLKDIETRNKAIRDQNAKKFGFPIDIPTQPVPALAEGGVSSGPISGYQAELHGTEAVVPLPDGKTIPVTMTESAGSADKIATAIEEAFGKLSDNQSGLLAELLYEMRTNNRLTGGILDNSY